MDLGAKTKTKRTRERERERGGQARGRSSQSLKLLNEKIMRMRALFIGEGLPSIR